MKPPVQLADLTTLGLFSLYAGVLDELRARGVTRSANNPVADYAENLVAQALDLELAPKSTRGHDAVGRDGVRYEIKSRRITSHNGSRQLSAIRGLDEQHFDFLVGVLFREDFTVQRACVVPYEVVVNRSTYRKHPNAWVLHLRDEIWNAVGVTDITEDVSRVQAR